MARHTFSISTDFSSGVDVGALHQQIRDSSIDSAKINAGGVSAIGDNCHIDVNPDLTAAEYTTLTNDASPPTAGSVIGDHDGQPLPKKEGTDFLIRVAVAAGGGGSPDDVEIYFEGSPPLRIMDVAFKVSAAVASSTCQLRDATGGGGNAHSDAMDTGSVGTKRDNGNASTTLAAGSSLYIHRSDNGVAVEVIITAWLE